MIPLIALKQYTSSGHSSYVHSHHDLHIAASGTALCHHQSAEEIASRLRQYEALINDGNPCSWVAWHLPDYNTDMGKAIVTQIAPLPDLSNNVKSIIYEKILGKIRQHLKDGSWIRTMCRATKVPRVTQNPLLPSELATALKVLTTSETPQSFRTIHLRKPSYPRSSRAFLQTTFHLLLSKRTSMVPARSQNHQHFPGNVFATSVASHSLRRILLSHLCA
jgi:hypothetical protein